MARNRKAGAQRVSNGFRVRVARTANPADGVYELFVYDNGEITGLPGTEDDVVLIMLADTEIRAEGWPSVADKLMRRHRHM